MERLNLDFKRSPNNFFLILFVGIFLSLGACSDPKKSRKVIFEEKAGVSRSLEYVQVSFNDYHEKVLFLKDVSTGTVIRGEKLNHEGAIKDATAYIFPISIKANEKKTFSVDAPDQELDAPEMVVTGKGIALIIENEYFIADFNTNDSKTEKGLYPGQLAGIFVKKKEVLLERGHINMHWAPNFQREESDYKTIGHIDSGNARVTQKNQYLLEMVKSGNVDGYEEIDVFGQYNFFAGLPYFEFTSTMTFNKDAELLLLRNDEMTIDSLFTHLIYPDSSGTKMPLYDMAKFDSLTKRPLADDIKWVGFINEPLEYGLVSLRLAYDNQNVEGGESPLYRPHTKISASMGSGRYWNRRLIHEHKTLVPEGSKYYEKNAYLVIDGLDDLDGRINYYAACLNKPVTVSYSSE